MTRPIQVIANPNSAGGRGRRLLDPLRSSLTEAALPFEFHVTDRAGHASDLAVEVRTAGAERILIVGGDGTIHEVVNGLLRSVGPGNPAPLPSITVVPTGTGNDFHRMMRARRAIADAVAALRSGVVREFDLGVARWEGGEEYFVNLLGVGIDVAVLQRRDRFQRLPGLGQYLAALGSALADFEPVPLQLRSIDESGEIEMSEAPTLVAAVTVGPSIGGGFMVAPDASPDDGLLDLLHVQPLGFRGLARNIPRVLRGTLRETERIRMRRIQSVSIETTNGRPFHFELDGELIPDPITSLQVEVVLSRLRVLDAPEDAR